MVKDMVRSEKSVLNDTLMKVSELPRTLVYRQNTGQAWQGRPLKIAVGEYVKVTPGMKILADARPINFGLEGAGDVVGVHKGKPLQIETKTLTGPQRTAQKNFEKAWVKAGGIYILARTPEEAVEGVVESIG